MNDLIRNIVHYLREQIPDPNPSRHKSGVDWIIGEFPELVNVEYPLICVFTTQVSHAQQGVNSGARYTKSASLRIVILTDHLGRYIVNGDDAERWEVVEALYDEVKNYLNGNDTKFVEWGWTRPIPENTNRYIQDDAIGYICDYRVRQWDTGA